LPACSSPFEEAVPTLLVVDDEPSILHFFRRAFTGEEVNLVTELDSQVPVIFITGHGTTATAIEAMQLGAYEYLLKPSD
jgi:two-component system nitrogen regulation response regulator GlnG